MIDLNKEMLARLPFAQWPGRFLSDGVHYTHGTTQFPSTSDPYANGGDPATHTTGLALTYNGYGLKGWLGVQKMKEIKQLVIDGVSPTPTVTMSASPASITSGAASTLTWSSTNATTVSINQGIGAVALSGTTVGEPDRDHHLHGDRHQRCRFGHRDRHGDGEHRHPLSRRSP